MSCSLHSRIELNDEATATALTAPEPLHGIIAIILERHHAYLKRELPALEVLVYEVSRSGAGECSKNANLLLPMFLRFRRELEAHMKREEVTLFPLIAGLESAVRNHQQAPRNSFGPLSNAIAFMNEDHDFECALLGKMAEITNNFVVPADAPEPYRVLLQRLTVLAADMAEHIRIEDKLLFPRAVLLEESHA